MGHLEVRGFEQHIGSWSHEGVEAKIFDKFDMAMSGHFHHKSDNGTIYYLGNPYEIKTLGAFTSLIQRQES